MLELFGIAIKISLCRYLFSDEEHKGGLTLATERRADPASFTARTTVNRGGYRRRYCEFFTGWVKDHGPRVWRRVGQEECRLEESHNAAGARGDFGWHIAPPTKQFLHVFAKEAVGTNTDRTVYGAASASASSFVLWAAPADTLADTLTDAARTSALRDGQGRRPGRTRSPR